MEGLFEGTKCYPKLISYNKLHYQGHAQHVMSRQMSGASYSLDQLSKFVDVLKSGYSIHVFCKTTSCHIGYHNEMK